MERAWQQVRDEGIMFLGVNVGEDADTIFEFTGSYPVSFPLPMDLDGTVVKSYPVVGLPTTYVDRLRRVAAVRDANDERAHREQGVLEVIGLNDAPQSG